MKECQLHFTKMVLYYLVLSSGLYETIMKLPFPHFPLIHKMLQLGILGCEQALQGYRPAARVLQRACSQSKGILPAKPFFHLLSFDVLEKDSAHELSKIVVENALHAARIHF